MKDFSYHLDLHTHSSISYDGGISPQEYEQILADGKQYIAITDHNEISAALALHARFGHRVIVGEEIETVDGELIGLFLQKRIEPHLSAQKTIELIRQQNGLVYVPHPLERTRKGMSSKVLQEIAGEIDILEVFNGRSKEPWRVKQLEHFAKENMIVPAASSDAHSLKGFGRAHCEVAAVPERDNLLALLEAVKLRKVSSSFASRFAPLKNKFKKKFKR